MSIRKDKFKFIQAKTFHNQFVLSTIKEGGKNVDTYRSGVLIWV